MLGFLQAATQATLGGRFAHVCIIGLNQAELSHERLEQSGIADDWKDITDEQIRKRMCLVFCAPRELDGTPMNPYAFLAGDDEDAETLAMLEQQLAGIPLIDLGRLPKAETGDVNIVVAADMLLHWDSKDSFVQPTNKYTWLRDIERLCKDYPKNANYTVYTDWDPEQVGSLSLPIKPLKSLPLHSETWLNEPTVQEKFGSLALIASIILAGLAYGGLYLQQQQLDRITEQIRIVQQRIPREGQYRDLGRHLSEQEKFMKYRETFTLAVYDIARSIELSNMKIDNFGLENPTPTEPNPLLVSTIEAERDAYKGWLQEEPVARKILLNSATLQAVRKPPGNLFKLEGLIHLPSIAAEAKKEQAVLDALESPEANQS